MSNVQELLSAYIAEHRREGRADPLPYLDDAGSDDRTELAALIDQFLATRGHQPFDAAAFERFRSRPEIVAMSQRIVDRAPLTLVNLRRDAGVSKVQLGERLARDLGVEGCAGEVKARYHDLETGTVDPARVRGRVWEAIAAAFGIDAAHVRAGATGAFGGPRLGGAFARTDVAPAPGAPVAAEPVQTDAERRVDEAFFERDRH